MPSVSYVPKRNEYIEQFDASHVSIARSFSVRKDSCGNPEHYTKYLCENAIQDANIGMGITFALIQYDEEDRPVRLKGYVSLKAACLMHDNGESFIGEPGIEISELAVDGEFAGQGIGRALLDQAVYHCNCVREHIGVKHLLVCAEPKAVEFYRHVLKFDEVRKAFYIPRELWNINCVPMYLKLQEKTPTEPCYITDDDDEEDEI